MSNVNSFDALIFRRQPISNSRRHDTLKAAQRVPTVGRQTVAAANKNVFVELYLHFNIPVNLIDKRTDSI